MTNEQFEKIISAINSLAGIVLACAQANESQNPEFVRESLDKARTYKDDLASLQNQPSLPLEEASVCPGCGQVGVLRDTPYFCPNDNCLQFHF